MPRRAPSAAATTGTDGVEGEAVELTALASSGDAVGRLADGRVVFVAGGVPGEVVTLADVAPRKRFVRARVGSIVRESEARRTPPCAHFGTCGGCAWQHVAYDAQLEAKRTIVRDALERIAGETLSTPIPIVASPSDYGYRARARWVEVGSGIGFRTRGSRGIAPILDCPVLVPAAREALHARLATLAEDAKDMPPAPPRARDRRKLREQSVTAGREGEAIVVPIGPGRAPRRAPGASAATGAGAADAIEIEVAGERLRVGGRSFVQGNALLWDALVESVRAAAGLEAEAYASTPRRFVELYCGVGFFTLPLARSGAQGTALESDPHALADLRHNLDRAGLASRVDVLAGAVEARGDLRERLAGADVVLLDPPRAGLAEPVRAALRAAAPPRIVYVSCDPATLARDVAALVEGGYRLASIRAFDLFPQTPHVESVAVLERADA